MSIKRYTYKDAVKDTEGSLEVSLMSNEERHLFLLNKVEQENFIRSHLAQNPLIPNHLYISKIPVRQLV